jgi:hypothetical protein
MGDRKSIEINVHVKREVTAASMEGAKLRTFQGRSGMTLMTDSGRQI